MPFAGSLHSDTPSGARRTAATVVESISEPIRLVRLTLGALLVVVSLVTTAIVVDASSAGADTTTDEQRFVDKINDLRSEHGLGPLAVDAELVAGARDWTERLRSDGALSHAPDLSVGVTSYWLKLGENVGVAPKDQLDALFDAFVASPDHYANLIDPDFTYVGVGVLYDDDGRMWTTHRFMEVGEEPVPATPTVPTDDSTTTTVPSSTSTPPTTESPSAAPSTTTPPSSAPAAEQTSTAPTTAAAGDDASSSTTTAPESPAAATTPAPVATNDLVPARVPLASEPIAELLEIVAG